MFTVAVAALVCISPAAIGTIDQENLKLLLETAIQALKAELQASYIFTVEIPYKYAFMKEATHPLFFIGLAAGCTQALTC